MATGKKCAAALAGRHLLALLTHPLLDAHTAYGTQLFWPLASPPVMWSTLFIIDPIYTLPLLIGVIVAAISPAARRAGVVLVAGLAMSTAYLGWSWVGKLQVERHARAELSRLGMIDAPLFSGPTPFNTLLWRVVALTEGGYLEGYDSLLVNKQPIRFESYSTDNESLRAASNIWAVSRLRWFAQDFLKTEVRDQRLVLTDLRMGAEPQYVFSHVVAKYGNPHWKPCQRSCCRSVSVAVTSICLSGASGKTRVNADAPVASVNLSPMSCHGNG